MILHELSPTETKKRNVFLAARNETFYIEVWYDGNIWKASVYRRNKLQNSYLYYDYNVLLEMIMWAWGFSAIIPFCEYCK